MDILGLHFIRPLWLLLLPVAVLIPVLWRVMRRPSGDWSKVCDEHLLRWLSVGQASSKPSRLGPWLAGLVWLIATLSLSGPSWEQLPDVSFSSQDARVLVLDLSNSMLAEDLKPNRLTQARFKVLDMLDGTVEGQTGLIAYAGDAFVVSPLTNDTNTISNMLPALRPDIIPVPGSRPDRGLELAAELLTRAGLARGEILLIADSGSRAASNVAAELAKKGIYTSVLGVGTAQGAPIPSGDGFVSDKSGNIVVARLEREALQAIANAGGGKYSELTSGSTNEPIISNNENSEFALRDDSLGERWRDMGPWLLLLLLPIGAYSFRRGLLFLLPLLVLPGMFVPSDAQAGLWDDLWYSPDQQAQRALQEERPADAAALAKSPAIAGEALYRSGEFETAATAFAQVDEFDGFYNQGNAMAKAGKLEEALAAYDAALAINPDDEDAQFNRDLVEQLKQQQDQEQQDQQDQENQDGDESQDQNSDESEEGEKSDEESSEQQDQQQEGDESEPEESEEEGEPSEQQMEQNWSEEDAQAMEQWLRRIPDDPGGLLRRKFRNQHQRRGAPAGESDNW
jgi:Ca-activated chloride channel family protein